MKDPLRDAPSQPQHEKLDATRAARFMSVRDTTRGLAAPLSAEDCAIQSMPDARDRKSVV